MEGERTLPEPGPPPGRARRSTASAAIDETAEQGWKGYAVSRPRHGASSRSSPATSCCGCRTSCRSTRAAIPAQSPDLAFNTSVSFETNTNWQNYSGETGASYLTQAAVLAVRNFTSAATGLAIAIALFRGLTRRSVEDHRQLLGRPDPRRPVHPAADLDRRRARPRLAGRPADVGSGPRRSTTLQGAQQTIALGPIASQEFDQGARQQRRRLPQCQLRPSVREPDAADELARDVRHPGRSRSR